MIRFVLGTHIYDVDVADDDYDIAFNNPKEFPVGEEVMLGGGLHALKRHMSAVALPYDLDRIKTIRGRMVERELPSE